MDLRGPVIIVLARDSDLTSLRNGAAEIYWTKPDTYEASRGARSWYLRTLILNVANNAAIRIVGQWSVDGHTWNDFVANVDGRRTLPTANPMTAAGSYSFQYTGTPDEHANFVRFGIEVGVTSGTDQARVRMSAEITCQPFVAPYLNTFAAAEVVVVSQRTGQLLYTNAYKSGLFTCNVTAAVGATVLTLQGSNDNTNFYSLGTFSFSATGLQTPISVDKLPEYVRVFATTLTTSATVTLEASLRPE